jgi:hypothetical protein
MKMKNNSAQSFKNSELIIFVDKVIFTGGRLVGGLVIAFLNDLSADVSAPLKISNILYIFVLAAPT